MNKKSILAIVVPCYNEEECLNDSNLKLLEFLHILIKKNIVSSLSKILYVNDGSKDATWNIIEKLSVDNNVGGVNLAGNVGHQNALLAGISVAVGFASCIVTIDADLQDDYTKIEDMIFLFQKKNIDIVYGVRDDRTSDSFFKRFTAQGFYKFMSFLGVNTVYNHADYRLMSNRSSKALLDFPERNIFLRGIIPKIGFSTDIVKYKRSQRIAGETKYPLVKMISFAIDGITSLSIKPVRMITYLGILFILFALGISIYVLSAFIHNNVVPGWTSLMISMWFIGGVILIGLGIVGEYIGKIYLETKKRPRFFISEIR